MELSHQHNLLEELIMGPKIDTYFPNELIVPNGWSLSPFNETPDLHLPNPSFIELISQPADELNYPCPSFGDQFQPFLDALTSPQFGSFYDKDHALPPIHEDSTFFLDTCFHGGITGVLDDGTLQLDHYMDHDANAGLFSERKCKPKKPDGQPSKNLMAERRRRKRLNDRLSMLRSIVPKISKMDRTSILGDTIDYMRELLDKIHKLRDEGMDVSIDEINLVGNYLKEIKPNEMHLRNTPKFDVERRKEDTRVEVCCTTKPGLLLSTLSTLDVLGLDIQQCVISCFNDFSLQASCLETGEQRSIVSSEDVKQALFRTAGYGGRCL